MIQPAKPKQSLFFLLQKFVGILLLAYLFFLVGRTVIHGQKNRDTINEINASIKAQEIKNQKLKALIEYEQTDAFKEKQLRQKLGYKKEGETVISIPENADDNVSPSPSPSSSPSSAIKQPNYILWYKYVFPKK